MVEWKGVASLLAAFGTHGLIYGNYAVCEARAMPTMQQEQCFAKYSI